jgi:hypothetical protein
MMAKEKRNGFRPQGRARRPPSLPPVCRGTSRSCAARMRAGRALGTGIAGLDELLLGGFPARPDLRGPRRRLLGPDRARPRPRRAADPRGIAGGVGRSRRSSRSWFRCRRRGSTSRGCCGCAGSGADATRPLSCPRSPRWARCSAPGCSKPSSSTSPASRPRPGSACRGRRGSACSGLIEDQPSALVLIADGHVSHGPTGAALALKAAARAVVGCAARAPAARRGGRGARGPARPARRDRGAGRPAPEAAAV